MSKVLSLPGFDRHLCVVANRWGARRAVAAFFGAISRLGDGVFWYSLMAVLAVFGGWHGALAALQMLLTGAASHPATPCTR